MRVTDNYVFFYGDWPSNFYASKFRCKKFNETHEFVTSEQAFMWCKAKTFNDEESAQAILKATDPAITKKLGRLVKNYVDDLWDQVRYQYMVDVNFCKYTQDLVLYNRIIDTRFDGKTFVEASPSDHIWGICLRENDPKADDARNWKGQNLLGFALTEVRNKILQL